MLQSVARDQGQFEVPDLLDAVAYDTADALPAFNEVELIFFV